MTGLDICVNLWNLINRGIPLPDDLGMGGLGSLRSPRIELDTTLLWAPHHIASFICCMLAFLLAWLAGMETARGRCRKAVVLIAFALASAFGLSIYVAFGFFLVMLAWAIWQVAIERRPRPALLLAAGGAGAAILLIPYLRELTQTSSGLQGGSVFTFAVREMFPPEGLLASHLFQHLVTIHPLLARNLANLVLLTPGYVAELGFYLAVLLIYLIPAWRGRTPLTTLPQRSLLVIAAVTLVIVSVMRSSVLTSNDFGWRAAHASAVSPTPFHGSEVIAGCVGSHERKDTVPA